VRRVTVVLAGMAIALAAASPAAAGTPNWLPLRATAKVGCVKTSCNFGGKAYHGYWAIDFLDPDRSGGDPIYAAGSGKVASLGAFGSCLGDSASAIASPNRAGNWVEVDHGGGIRTRYNHLRSIAVKTGQTVSTKTKLGTMGNTGASTCKSPHLHFEKKVNGSKVDPGALYACHGSAKVSYSQWNSNKDTLVRSDGVECGTPPPAGALWYIRNYTSAGPSATSFGYGRPTDRPLVGNWDGVGGDTVGVFRSGAWYLRNYNSAGPSSLSFSYGRATDIPVVGDWDGDGDDTIGVFRSGTWYLRNSNSSGSANIVFGYGRSTDRPIVGNWDGVGGDTVGVFRAGTWYIRNYNSAGSSATSFGYGRSTDTPIVGNWDGVGGDTIGVFRSGTWYIRNYNSAGPSATSFAYGRSTDRPLVGDWDGHVGDTIGVFR
jgi:Peptidase family M23